jgi:hypothetical protein
LGRRNRRGRGLILTFDGLLVVHDRTAFT